MYEKNGFRFLKNAFDDPQYLEEVTGLAQLKRESEKMLTNNDWVDDDSDSSDVLL